MATPIQYIPQPIFSNVGMLQQQLAQDQARHDLAMQQQVAMEDMFAEVPTHPTDIPIKNKVLGDFQSKVQEVVDRYGGDYGAAAKDIARLTSKTRQNPFFQLAPERRRLAEEERKARLQLGPNYIPIQSVTDKPLQDPESGEWVSPEELSYDYEDRRKLRELAQQEYDDVMKRVEDSGWYQNQKFPWMLQKDVTRGARQEEVPELAANIKQTLLETRPELQNAGEDQVNAIAQNLANEFVLGTRSDEMIDPTFGKEMAGERSGMGNLPYFVSVYQEEGKPVVNKRAQSALDKYNSIQNTLAEADEEIETLTANLQEKGATSEYIDRMTSNAKNRRQQAKEEWDNTIKELKKDIPLFEYLTEEKDLDENEALGKIQDIQENTLATGYFGTTYYPEDKESVIPEFLRGFTSKISQNTPIYKETPEGDREKLQEGALWWKSNKPIGQVLTEKGIDINDVGYNFEDEEFVLETSKEGEGFTTYKIPFSGVKDQAIKESLRNFKEFTDAYTGIKKPGEYPIGSDERPSYVLDVDYSDEGDLERNIYKVMGVKDGEVIKHPEPIPVQMVMSDATSNLFTNYGLKPDYKAPKIK
jgi:hypothetical protein